MSDKEELPVMRAVRKIWDEHVLSALPGMEGIIAIIESELANTENASSDAWRTWFIGVGEHATVDVVNATAKLVLAERELRQRELANVEAGWRDIESAPKDGVEILLYAMGDMGICYWRDDMSNWTWGLGKKFQNPSHWMHLPPPPRES